MDPPKNPDFLDRLLPVPRSLCSQLQKFYMLIEQYKPIPQPQPYALLPAPVNGDGADINHDPYDPEQLAERLHVMEELGLRPNGTSEAMVRQTECAQIAGPGDIRSSSIPLWISGFPTLNCLRNTTSYPT